MGSSAACARFARSLPAGQNGGRRLTSVLAGPAPAVAVFGPPVAAVAEPDVDPPHLVQVAEVALRRGPAHPGRLGHLGGRHLPLPGDEQPLRLPRRRPTALMPGSALPVNALMPSSRPGTSCAS